MRKKRIIVPLIIIVLIVAGVGLYMSRQSPPSAPATSTHKKVSLDRPVMSLKNGQELAGTYHKAKDQELFYTIANKKKIVASGSILADKDGSFSRNITFDAKPAKGDSLTLKLIVQNTKGDTVDELTVDTKYQ